MTQIIEFNGKSQSIEAWAQELGIPVFTLRARLRNGWSIERALTEKAADRSEKPIEFHGQVKTLSEWARELGIPRATLNARIKRYGWDVEKAFAKSENTEENP